MVTCKVIEPVAGEMVDHGAQTFETLPRIGEWIGMEENGNGVMFSVKMVAHSNDYHEGVETNGADIYVTRIGSTLEALLSLYQ